MTHVRTQHLSLLVALAGAVALSACGKKEEPAPPPPATAPAPAPAPTTPPPPAAAPVAVDSVDLGSAGDATSNKITTPTTTFTPKDTIYASVATTGAAPNAELKAKWTFQDGQTVKETSQTIAPNGPANTLFKIEKPDGWPVGNYKVEILLNGTSTQTKEFSVK